MEVVSKTSLINNFTSTGQKFFYHRDAMEKLKNGRGKPITCHIILCDVCNHSCAYCSVSTRIGASLKFSQIQEFLNQLISLGLKSVIISGGGNPILYKDNNLNFNDLINYIYDQGLEIGLITNGMPLKDFNGRKSWIAVKPESLDKFKWIRISMAGLDHKEGDVYVPDIDQSKTTLGFSYIYHDIYYDPLEKNHGKVSSIKDLITPLDQVSNIVYGKDRLPWLKEKIEEIVKKYNPKYIRLLPNCLEEDKINERCEGLSKLANEIDSNIVFVQYKPPKSPNVCYLGYFHPVLNSDGFCYPCDSCVLNEGANHSFALSWRVCSYDRIAEIYNKPITSLIKNPHQQCSGCVFSRQNELLERVRNGLEIHAPENNLEHVNFI